MTIKVPFFSKFQCVFSHRFIITFLISIHLPLRFLAVRVSDLESRSFEACVWPFPSVFCTVIVLSILYGRKIPCDEDNGCSSFVVWTNASWIITDKSPPKGKSEFISEIGGLFHW